MSNRKLKILDDVLIKGSYFARLGTVLCVNNAGDPELDEYLVEFESDIHYKEATLSIPKNDLIIVPITRKITGKKYRLWSVYSLNDQEEILAYEKMTFPRLKFDYGSVRTFRIENALVVYVSENLIKRK